jgi:hypothetical protein
MTDQLMTKDAVEVLLEGRPHPTAQKLLDFHRANRGFFVEFAAEFFWLKKRKRAGAAKALLMFFRKNKRWTGVDRFMVNDHIFPLLSRICILLYPPLNNRTLKLHHCEADTILGTWIGTRGGKKKGTLLHANESLSREIAQLPPVPEPPALTKRSTRHRTVTAEESAWVIPYIEELVAGCPYPNEPILQSLLRHARTQPEVLALAERRLPKRRQHFSALDCLTYGEQTAKRTGHEKRFTMPSKIEGLYCRALIRRNPRLNGFAEFKEDSKGAIRPGRTNAVLGCYVASEPVNGEPHPRLHWFRDEV